MTVQTEPTDPAPTADEQLKARHRALWTLGDYSAVADRPNGQVPMAADKRAPFRGWSAVERSPSQNSSRTSIRSSRSWVSVVSAAAA
jgi:hypothetical protein